MTRKTRPTQGSFHSLARTATRGTAAVLALLGIAGTANAKDAVRATVEDADGGIVTQNGAFLTPGTYAIGTLKIDYFVAGQQFQADMPKTIRACFDTVTAASRGASSQATVYPVAVDLVQVGSSNLTLQASANPIVFGFAGDLQCVDIAATVPAAVASDPQFQADGTELVANLQLKTAAGSNLDTVTTIKVHMTLVHPVACLRALHSVLNQDLTGDLTTLGISLKFGNNGKLTSNPVNSHHLLALVNTCDAAVAVDVATRLDENFELFQANAVRTTILNQEIGDEAALLTTDLAWDDFGSVSPASMCLQGVSVPAGQTVLIAQRMGIREDGRFPGDAAIAAGRDLGAWSYDGFAFEARDAGGACSLALSDDVLPNQGGQSVPVTEVTLTGNDGNAAKNSAKK